MDLWTILWTIYALVAVTSIILTRREQLRTCQRILAYRVAGFLACTAWPLVFPIVFLSAQSRRV